MVDLDKIRKKFEKLSNTNDNKKWFWKPEQGVQAQVRIVPYVHRPTDPFVELYFHYNMGNKNYLSPMSFGKPDPFVEIAEKLQSTGSKEDWLFGRKLFPKLRIFVPVVVRGEEEKGVRIWSIGKTVYKDLLSYMADPEYGDITDPKNGFDLLVLTTKPEGQQYPETSIKAKRLPSPVGDKALIEKIKECPDVTTMYELPTYEVLQKALAMFVDGADSSESTDELLAKENNVFTNTTVDDSDENVVDDGMTNTKAPDEDDPWNTPSSKAVENKKKAAKAEKAAEVKSTGIEDLESEFDSMFKS